MKKTKQTKKCFGRSRVIVGKGENKFSPFPTMFSKALILGLLKCKDYVVKSEKIL